MTQVMNPFSTRHVRPGAIAYIFPHGSSTETIVRALRDENWWGQIVGPHGTGKSTLVQTLLPKLERHGRRIELFRLNEKQRSLGVAESVVNSWDQQTLVVVDGYEQLSWSSRRKLKQKCHKYGAGLLVTAHRSVRLPMVAQTSSSPALAQQVVALLLSATEMSISVEEFASWLTKDSIQGLAPIPPDEASQQANPTSVSVPVWKRLLDQCEGNMRELLFRLYDVYEHWRRAPRD